MRRGCSNSLANAAAAGAACRCPPGSVGSLQRQPQGPSSEHATQHATPATQAATPATQVLSRRARGSTGAGVDPARSTWLA